MTRSLYPLLIRGSRLNRTHEKLYTMVVRPAITYAAPVWCSITTMKNLQVLAHKFMRLVSNPNRYTFPRDLYARWRCNDISPLTDYVRQIFQKLYELKLGGSPVTRDTTRIRQHNAPFGIKRPITILGVAHFPATSLAKLPSTLIFYYPTLHFS